MDGSSKMVSSRVTTKDDLGVAPRSNSSKTSLDSSCGNCLCCAVLRSASAFCTVVARDNEKAVRTAPFIGSLVELLLIGVWGGVFW